MKIIVASDSYKGSCSAKAIGDAISLGIKRIIPDADILNIPVADGGEGSVEAMVYSGGGEIRMHEVTDPLGGRINAAYGVLPSGAAIIEMSAASGLPLVPVGMRNPAITTTFGTGELIKAALDDGCTSIFLGIGGSATNDAGAGMAQALGISLLDKNGNELKHGGAALADLSDIDMSGLDPRIKSCCITAACDVKNPLCGPTGASAVYGPQKGAALEMVNQLDAALRNFAAVVKEKLHIDVLDVPGAGGAGGLGAGLLAFCGAELQPGIDTVLDFIDFNSKLTGADLVITGEGRIDEQTAFGKVPVGVAARAKAKLNIPVIAVVGSIGPGAEKVYSHGIDAILPIADGPITLEESQRRTPELLARCAETIARIITALGHFGE